MFNSDIIPCLCIIVVTAPALARIMFRVSTLGLMQLKSEWHTTESFEIDKPALIRDGIAVIIAELVLIFLLGKSTLTWVDGAVLMAIYLPYVAFMAWQSSKFENKDSDESDEKKEDVPDHEEEEDSDQKPAPVGKFKSDYQFRFQ